MKKSKPAIIQLKTGYCKHYLLWQLLRESCVAQAAHNKEYETKYSKDQNHEHASMQQQFRHGILWALRRMQEMEEGLDTSVKKKWILTPAPDTLGKPRCRVSAKVEKLLDEAIRKIKRSGIKIGAR